MNCEFCNHEHNASYGKGRFCNSKCRSLFAAKKTTYPQRKFFKCINCEEISLGKRAANEHKKICNSKIPKIKRKSNNTKSFESLVKDGTRKKRLIDEQEYRHCELEICLKTEWNGKPIPLQMDHIDGNPDNNDRRNLRLICPNCHAQTETYCGKNVGKHINTRRQKKFERYPSQNYR